MTKRKSSFNAVLAGAAIAAFTLTSLPGTGMAGFEWAPPQKQEPEKPSRLMPEPVDRDPTSIQRGMPEDIKAIKNMPQSEVTGTSLTRGEQALNPSPASENNAQANVQDGGQNRGSSRPLDLNQGKMTSDEGSFGKSGSQGTATLAESAAKARDKELHFGTVEGFGNQIPLALALRQIVPDEFSFSFDGISPGKSISWSGGKSWNKVLKDLLVTANAQALIDGNTVIVSPKEMGQERFMVRNAPKSLFKDTARDTMIASAPPSTRGRSQTDGPISLKSTSRNAPQTRYDTPSSGPIWTAAPGERVSDILKDWAKRKNTELFWNIDQDYALEKSYRFQGSLDEAANKLFSQVSGNAHQAQIYPNLPDGPAVLLVRRNPSPDNS